MLNESLRNYGFCVTARQLQLPANHIPEDWIDIVVLCPEAVHSGAWIVAAEIAIGAQIVGG